MVVVAAGCTGCRGCGCGTIEALSAITSNVGAAAGVVASVEDVAAVLLAVVIGGGGVRNVVCGWVFFVCVLGCRCESGASSG